MTDKVERQYETLWAVWVWDTTNRFWFLLAESDCRSDMLREAKRERGSCKEGEIVKVTKHRIRAPKVPEADQQEAM